MWHLIKYAVKQKYNSLSKAKSALLYRQFHLPVSCDLRCYSRIRGILIREIQRNQRFRTRGCFPLRHRCLSPKFVTEYLRYKHIGERKREIVKERIEGGANEKAVWRLFINCPFVCINFDFFWLNKVRQLYMDF